MMKPERDKREGASDTDMTEMYDEQRSTPTVCTLI